MRSLSSALIALVTATFSAMAAASSFPSQTIRIVTPFPPGGGTDIVARALAERLTPILGQSVVVENRPGGNSVIASRQVASAAPDGHTLLLTTDIHAINAAYGTQLPYDSLKDFTFVVQLTTSPLMLMAHPSLGVSTLDELVKLARQKPNELTFGSLGPSSPHFLGFEWWKRMADVRITDVPYKGGGQVLADNLGGQVGLSLIVAGNGMRHHQAGKLKALAVTSEKRSPIAPEIPSFAESGYPAFSIVNWYAIFAPAGTPAPIVERLNREIRAVLKEPAVVERLLGAGLQPTTGTPAELEALVKSDIDKYRTIIALTGAKLEER